MNLMRLRPYCLPSLSKFWDGEDQGNPKEGGERSDPGAEDQSSSPQGRREEEALITHLPPHLQLRRLLLMLERL